MTVYIFSVKLSGSRRDRSGRYTWQFYASRGKTSRFPPEERLRELLREHVHPAAVFLEVDDRRFRFFTPPGVEPQPSLILALVAECEFEL